jgi:NSS family neurotransmitter:Na+ symporter
MAEQIKGQNEQWSSRWGLVFAAIGMAVGTGNIWRFPRVAATNGGGAFYIAYFLALFLWAIPLLCAEAVWGKASRMGVIGSWKEMLGRKWTWVGGFIAWVCLAITFYYAVVIGWCIRYFIYAVSGVIKPGLDTEVLWKNFINDPMAGLIFFAIAVAMSLFICLAGVQNGLERANKIMIPSIFVLLIFLAVRANFLPNSWKGLEYLFTIRMEDVLKARTYLEAFTQVAWSTGAGWGLFLTYYVYASKKEDILLNSITTGFADTTAASLAALCVIPTIFAFSPDPMAAVKSGNNGIAFIHLTKLFAEIPGGVIMAIAFFLALIMAALSSEISMMELGCRILADAGWDRKKAAWTVGIACLICGAPSAMNNTFFENQDWVWGVGLLISGLLFSIGAMKVGVKKLWVEWIEPCSDVKVEWMWSLVKLFPLWFVVIFGWWLKQSISWYPGEWYKFLPISKYTYTPGTMFVQWAIAAAVFFVLNNWLADAMKYKLQAKD